MEVKVLKNDRGNIFYKPIIFFESLVKKPLILVPLLVLIIANVIYSLSIYPVALQNLFQNLKDTDIDKSFLLENQVWIETIACTINIANFIIGIVGTSILFYFISNIFVDKMNFKKILSLFLVSQIPNALNWIFISIEYRVFNRIPMSLIQKNSTMVDVLLDTFNFFFIMHLIMMIISIKILLNSKKITAIIIVLIYALAISIGKLLLG
ncbi:hypothetical protein [Bacillus siamensis]|uniref:hypothetical protein n=1 Tax=Bacillus TaxID=1386 RepID=UPI002E1CA0FE|nr:hypothetical protein [Bacillus siamensis]MED0777955.1 hypothetical protein [Bacillus siamensis]MED0781884.1 hypothetical protein [Bacillus siamensis]MED0836461.1 hypothetical protein [Bacillus siamensis]